MSNLSVTRRLQIAWAIARKDLTILRRDKAALFSLLGIPLMFATFFGAIFGGMMGGGGSSKLQPVEIAVVTPLPNEEAEAFVQRLADSGSVDIARVELDEARRLVRTGDRTLYLEILSMPRASEMLRGTAPTFRMGVDPSRQTTRGLMTGLIAEATFEELGQVMADRDQLQSSLDELSTDLQESEDVNFAQRALLKTAFDSFIRFLEDSPEDGDDNAVPGSGGFGMRPEIEVETVAREQRRKITSYDVSFPQAMAWALMGAASALALSLVKEARAGTLQRLRTTPVDGQSILLGKTLATALAGALVVVVLVAIGMLIFGIRIDDGLATGLAVGFSALAFAALGTFLGTLGRTEEAVSGASWGVLIVFAMLGGGMVPEIAMPDWMRSVAVLSPVRWSIRSLEGATWRAFDYSELMSTCGILFAFAAVFYVAGAIRMRSLRQ